jgi:phosphate starvation-inducible PhoH-like protein
MSEEITLRDQQETLAVCGPRDEHIDRLEDQFEVTIIPRGNQLIIQGDEERTRNVADLIDDYLGVYRGGENGADMTDFIDAWLEDSEASRDMAEETIIVSRKGKAIKPRSVNQQRYVEAIRNHDIVFGIGPAGTGKTFLGVAMAMQYLKKGRVSRIVLARPAVEAGDTLGFLPGGLEEKVNPYLRPLYDSIYNLMDIETCDRMLEEGTIEIAPLSFMRGRTLSDSFVILDEAQNKTALQMKMFLTRFGPSSHGVVTGDITQIDLPSGTKSGLVEASDILTGIEDIEFVEFDQSDVVRHSLVQKVIDAYEDSGTV